MTAYRSRGQLFFFSCSYLYDTHSTELNFVLVSDPDTASAIDKARTNFQAILKSGKLIRKETGKYEVELLADSPIQSKVIFFETPFYDENRLMVMVIFCLLTSTNFSLSFPLFPYE